jgi:ABC-type branched-subunit amino acid transport system substrate-binding protein
MSTRLIRPRRWAGIALLVSIGLTVTSCSDSSKDDSGATNLSGKPIKLLTIQQITAPGQEDRPEAVAAAKAAVSSINAAGGVNGRPLVLDSCDDKVDPNAGAACGRKAVSGGYAAVVGSTSAQGNAYYPILEQAGIPNIGPFPINPGDFTSKTSFPLAAGGPMQVAGMPVLLGQVGAKRAGIAYIDIPSAAVGNTFIGLGAKGAGVTVTSKTPIPLGTADLTSVATAAAKGNDGVMLVTQPVQTAAYLKTAAQQGLKTKVAATALSPDLLKQLGPAAEGLLISRMYAAPDSGVAGVKAFDADMDKYQPKAVRTDYAITTWLAVQAVAKEIQKQKLTTIDHTSLTKAFETERGLDLGGIVPNFSSEKGLPIKGLNRIFTPLVMFQQVKNGKVVAVNGKWVSPLTP